MPRRLLPMICLLVSALVLKAPTTASAEPLRDGCVILISVDGLANFYFDEQAAHMPILRKFAREGAKADGIVCSFPTNTWPNHTTLVTGTAPAKHGVLGNNYLDRKSGEKIALIPDPLFDKDQLVTTPTVYDVAHNAGLVTAGIIWPATRNARTLDFTVPDMFGNDSWAKYGTQGWLAELREIGVPVDNYGEWVKQAGGGVPRDWLYSRMADHLFQNHPPNLLLIHLVEVDHVQHKHGPRTADAYWSVSYADSCIRDIWEASQRSPYAEKTAIVVASDHGFFPIDRDIRANAVLVEAGLVDVEDGKVTKKRAWCVSQGGACMVYVLEDAGRDAAVAKLKDAFTAVEGIQAVFTPDEFQSKLGQATPSEDSRAPDLWLAAESGYSFTEAHTGEAVTPRSSHGGTHGYLPDQPDMLGSLVIYGYGVKPGTKLGKVNNTDVAPTIARLLGVDMPSADGKALLK